MKAVWKFPLGDDKKVIIEMPKDAKILTVQTQFEEGVIWAMVNVPAEFESRRFQSFHTGEEFLLKPDWAYLGTYQLGAGNTIVHIFETPN